VSVWFTFFEDIPWDCPGWHTPVDANPALIMKAIDRIAARDFLTDFISALFIVLVLSFSFFKSEKTAKSADINGLGKAGYPGTSSIL